MIDFDLKYRILPEPHDGLLSVYHLIYIAVDMYVVYVYVCTMYYWLNAS